MDRQETRQAESTPEGTADRTRSTGPHRCSRDFTCHVQPVKHRALQQPARSLSVAHGLLPFSAVCSFPFSHLPWLNMWPSVRCTPGGEHGAPAPGDGPNPSPRCMEKQRGNQAASTLRVPASCQRTQWARAACTCQGCPQSSPGSWHYCYFLALLLVHWCSCHRTLGFGEQSSQGCWCAQAGLRAASPWPQESPGLDSEPQGSKFLPTQRLWAVSTTAAVGHPRTTGQSEPSSS